MPFILRQSNQDQNPTLPGGVYGKYITIGKPVYYKYDGSQTRFIIFISDGGRYGLDKIDTFEYKGVALDPSTWKFHRGTFPKQISPKVVTVVDATANAFTINAHGFAENDPIKLATTGLIPTPLIAKKKYYAKNVTANTFQVSETVGGAAIDISSIGTGTLRAWKAYDCGFDDLEQGLPDYCPEVNSTFNNIAYIEGKLPIAQSSISDPPDWEDFRILGTGRRLQSYDANGTALGVISNNDNQLANVALQIVDNLIVNYKVKKARIDFPSLLSLKQAADVTILQRPKENTGTTVAAKFTGRYYSQMDFSGLISTQLDTNINFNWGAGAPVPGAPTSYYSVRWTGQIKALYNELYTFSLLVDDIGKVYIDGQLLIDATYTMGTVTAQMQLQAGRVYSIQIDYQAVTNPNYIYFKWQSASQALEFVPAVSADTYSTVNRYANHSAIASPIEASEYHERLMERVPGWDWTDDEKIKFLPPDRPFKFNFNYDLLDDDSKANFVKGTFNKKRRLLSDRENFRLFKYRNVQETFYPVEYVQADREALRRLNGGEPNNDAAEDLGVATRSLAERMAENEMVFKSDPSFSASIAGARPSSKVRKNDLVKASYYDFNDNFVVDGNFIVTLHSWGDKTGKNDFALLPIIVPFYTDEPVSEEAQNPPDTLNADWIESSSQAHVTWVNHGALGDNIIERSKDGGSYTQVGVVPFYQNFFDDLSISLNGVYTYRVRNLNFPTTYTNTDSITVNLGAGGEPSPVAPDTLSTSIVNTTQVYVGWLNHGATGNNIVERKKDTGAWETAATLGSSVHEWTDTTITETARYTYRVHNTNATGYTNEDYEDITISSGGGGGGTATAPTLSNEYGLNNLDGTANIGFDITPNGGSGTYRIERRINLGSWVLLDDNYNSAATSFEENVLIPYSNTTYSYQVKRNDVTGYSNIVSVTLFGTGGGGGGGGGCPALDQFVLARNDKGEAVSKQVIDVQIDDYVYNPVHQCFERVKTAEVIEANCYEVIAANGVISIASETHPLIRHIFDRRGKANKYQAQGNQVLTYLKGKLENSVIEDLRFIGTRKVKRIETDGDTHIYASGAKMDEFIICHNNKLPEGEL